MSTRGRPGSNGYDAIATLTESNIFHGEFGLSQLLFMCPAPVCSQYRAPVDYLYPCGTATHCQRQHKTAPPDTLVEKHCLIFVQSDTWFLPGINTPAFFLSFSR